MTYLNFTAVFVNMYKRSVFAEPVTYVDGNSGLFSLEAAQTNMYDMHVCMIIYFHL